MPLLCNAHPEMAGYIIVSPTPYFAETDESGNYKLENVPDGKYNLVAWHEGMKQQTKPLSVPGTNKVDFSLSSHMESVSTREWFVALPSLSRE